MTYANRSRDGSAGGFSARSGAARSASRGLAVLLFAAAGVAVLPHEGRADPGSLEGSWSGGGWVSLADGSRERARCQVHYSARRGSHYTLNGTCATDSGKATQTAYLHRSGDGSYTGNFHNPEYDVNGQIRVVVRGNKQTVVMTSSAGVARIALSR